MASVSADLNINLAMAVRLVPGSGAAHPCDERCRRWGDLPHPHMVLDGLMADHPFLTMGGWCSCGYCFDEPVTYDVSNMPHLDERGTAQVEAFVAHMREAHGLDPETDEAWQRAASTDPDTL